MATRNDLTISNIRDFIYSIRGQQVMLDSDLATLYEVETRVINQTVRRNSRRFPNKNFNFQLSKEEYKDLRSQIVIANPIHQSRRRSLPWAFTEHGVAMLSGVLNTDRAIDVNITIVSAYASLKQKQGKQLELENSTHDLRKMVEELKTEFQSELRRIENNSLINTQLIIETIKKSYQNNLISSNIKVCQIITPSPSKQNNDLNVVNNIQERVAQYYNLQVEDLKKLSRIKTITHPRQITMYLIRQLTKMTFKEIAKLFSREDHSTVIYAHQKIENALAKNDQQISDSVRAIKKSLSILTE